MFTYEELCEMYHDTCRDTDIEQGYYDVISKEYARRAYTEAQNRDMGLDFVLKYDK